MSRRGKRREFLFLDKTVSKLVLLNAIHIKIVEFASKGKYDSLLLGVNIYTQITFQLHNFKEG
ncbi:hypothetical protein GCM10027170_38240 [Aliiglaciecola aliphaticivorans]